MFLIDDALHWSASDLTASAECEFAVLRRLDVKLGRAEATTVAPDPLMEHIARLGDRHEQRLLQSWRASGKIVELSHVDGPLTRDALTAAAAATATALASGAAMVYQAAFFDGEFFGYADFVERVDDGWSVCDAKLARSASPKALFQLGAYADQIARLGFPLSSTVSLLLGSGERADFPLADVLPAFRERRERLRALLHRHRAGGAAVGWGDDDVVSCGRCSECAAAARAADDVILIAGMRTDTRRRLRAAGLRTVGELAAAADADRPAGVAAPTFAKLRAQAALQWRQQHAGDGAPLAFELTDDAPGTLARLPEPSEGDLFFDFEGDPLYDEGDPTRVGLEYLWGVLDAGGSYRPLWAHDRLQERAAFVEFLDDLARRRARHPDLHVYHYAAYEVTALKRLAIAYQTHEDELDDLLRSEVFVDLYATVRGSVRVGASSYSIKKLEPLYMGDELRSDEDDAVADGGASVVAYHEYRELREAGDPVADGRLDALADYNRYDCLSTRRLRDWLLDRAVDAGVREQVKSRVAVIDRPPDAGVPAEDDPLFVALMAKAGPEVRALRTAEQQAYAMLAAALEYYRREAKQFWWAHFDRLSHPVEEWSDTRDVFVVESAHVVRDWEPPSGRARNSRRVLRLVGDWSPGSTGADGYAVYPVPGPAKAFGPQGGFYVATSAGATRDPDDARVVHLTESCPPDATFAVLPGAITPGSPPKTDHLEAAIRAIGAEAAAAGDLPPRAGLDVLARRVPRTRADLPSTGDRVADIVAALLDMSDSYVAVQGPPGAGKTFTGSRVIARLVTENRWRIGVVAQSHAGVETLLAAVVRAGVDPDLIGKSKRDAADADESWVQPPDTAAGRAEFLAARAESGCVLGGTAWTFAHPDLASPGELDLLVVDEAGQFSLVPTLAAGRVAKRLLLLGDPQQLPQVSQGSHPEPVDASALGWLMGEHATIPADRGYFLARSYRMHPALCERVSVLSYESRLEAAPAAAKRSLAGVDAGLDVVMIAHAGNRTQSAEEAAAVVDQIRAVLGATWSDPDDPWTPRPLTAADVLVVAPYNAQVALIRDALGGAGLHEVRVGTVDKFQGKEAPVVVVSMTASSHGDVPRGMGFLLSRNRVNVAVSRAQWRAIVVRSDALTAYLPSSTEGVLELGAFIGLCEPAPGERSGRT